MKRLFNILVFIGLAFPAFAQIDTRIVDSLQEVYATQTGREKVLTMIELTWKFYDLSFDDCIRWGERAVMEAQSQGMPDLVARANYVLGIQYAYHNDLDLAQDYLKHSFELYTRIGDEANAFEALWNQAYYELMLGNMDTAFVVFQKALTMAKHRHDTLGCAQIYSNLAVVRFQMNDFNGCLDALKASRKLYEALQDTLAVLQTDFNMTTVYGELGKTEEARSLYAAIIPQLETMGPYDYMLLAYKNYGQLLERDLANMDSAYYYLKKALACINLEGLTREDRQTVINTKADVLTELGNIASAQNEFGQAIGYYSEALSIAEANNYYFGLMQAVYGLGLLYAEQGQAAKSMRYFERYADVVASSGITIMEPSVKKALILNYARLGRFAEMEKEVDELDEQRSALARQNADLYEQNAELLQTSADLLADHNDNSQRIAELQRVSKHYRLAFFGLLCMVLIASLLVLVSKIVHKKIRKNDYT